MILGLVVLAGWAFHSLFLIQIAPHLAPMQRNTAVKFVCSGLVLLGMVVKRPRLTSISSGIAATLAGVSLLEYAFGANFGIDQLRDACRGLCAVANQPHQ